MHLIINGVNQSLDDVPYATVGELINGATQAASEPTVVRSVSLDGREFGRSEMATLKSIGLREVDRIDIFCVPQRQIVSSVALNASAYLATLSKLLVDAESAHDRGDYVSRDEALQELRDGLSTFISILDTLVESWVGIPNPLVRMRAEVALWLDVVFDHITFGDGRTSSDRGVTEALLKARGWVVKLEELSAAALGAQ